jgi:hypothetical protein
MPGLEDLPGWANTVVGDLLSELHRLEERIAMYGQHIAPAPARVGDAHRHDDLRMALARQNPRHHRVPGRREQGGATAGHESQEQQAARAGPAREQRHAKQRHGAGLREQRNQHHATPVRRVREHARGQRKHEHRQEHAVCTSAARKDDRDRSPISHAAAITRIACAMK